MIATGAAQDRKALKKKLPSLKFQIAHLINQMADLAPNRAKIASTRNSVNISHPRNWKNSPKNC